MEITLEKIELVKDRTGASYKEAKEALEASDGNVVDAIIKLEEEMEEKFQQQGTYSKANAKKIVDYIKELVKKGNIAKITVKKGDEVILNLPFNVGIVGAVIAPWGMLIATIAAFGTKCVIEVVRTDGSIVDVSEMAMETFDKAVENGSVLFEEVRVRGVEAYDIARDKFENAYYKVRYNSEACDGDCDACRECEECNLCNDIEEAKKAEAKASEEKEIKID